MSARGLRNNPEKELVLSAHDGYYFMRTTQDSAAGGGRHVCMWGDPREAAFAHARTARLRQITRGESSEPLVARSRTDVEAHERTGGLRCPRL